MDELREAGCDSRTAGLTNWVCDVVGFGVSGKKGASINGVGCLERDPYRVPVKV